MIIFLIAILILSVMLHELSHGYMADYLGDPTARLAGRLTINPLKHIDLFGSIIVPAISFLLFGFAFGWAKPVPYSPYNLKNKRVGEFLVAFAGPASNIILALIFGFIVRFMVGAPNQPAYIEILSYIVLVNILLAIFNLIPVPPLDGSKLVFSLMPSQYGKWRRTLESAGPFLFIFVVFFVWQFIFPIVPMIFRIITGVRL